jgi:hypothetical protein
MAEREIPRLRTSGTPHLDLLRCVDPRDRVQRHGARDQPRRVTRPRTGHESTPASAARVAARGSGLPRPLARVTHQHSKHLHGLKPGVVIGPTVDNDAIHHKKLSRLHRFDKLESLMEERVQALAAQLKQLRQELACAMRVRFPARPGTRHAELARDGRDLDAAPPANSYKYV